MINYAQQLPGFSDASPRDFGFIIKHRLFEFSYVSITFIWVSIAGVKSLASYNLN